MNLRQALWWAQDYLWAALVAVSAAFAPVDPGSYAHGSGRTIVAVPGLYEDWRFLRPLIVPLHHRGYPIHVLPDLGHTRAPIAEGAAAVLDLLAQRDLRDVVVLGHSKGGLIGKLALIEDAERRIGTVVAINTPFGGSSRARLLPLPSVRPLTPGHPSLAALTAEEAADSRITSIYGLFDQHVPEGSELPGADNVRLPVAGHFSILGRRATLSAVLDAIENTSPDDAGTNAG